MIIPPIYIAPFLGILFLFLVDFGTALLLTWLCTVAVVHFVEEVQGELWTYFGRISGNRLVEGFGFIAGVVLVVLPALGLQVVASWLTFRHGLLAPDPVWLGVLVGALVGDALASHLLLVAQGHTPNPGIGSALVYVVQGVMLTALCQPTIAEHPWLAGLGFAAGAGFFASVLPLMRATARLTA
ncbi:hypothetical protein [Verrucomicrobium spinosum]|uniref:hypothetical protein n=1 Tax=Verrucomicrobium spinosum TaxID=2736 RepID=UPI0001746695|nr:hypothetical protein [Verrucomicrobium spinosum]